MLTPRFSLSQDDHSVRVSIRAPFAKISEVEIDAVGDELHFFSHPYHLRLYFPGELAEDCVLSSYSSTEGTFEIKVNKKEPGVFFPDLDMLTKLLTPRGSWKIPRLPEEVDTCEEENETSAPDADESEFDWTYPQKMPGESSQNGLDAGSHRYGFALRRSGVFRTLTEEIQMVLDVSDVDSLTDEQVSQTRMEKEDCDFDEEHYLADLFSDEEIQEMTAFRPWWTDVPESGIFFDEDEVDILKELPRLQLPVPHEAVPYVWATLAELLFVYAYDCRTTLGSSTVESSWTVAKLSPSLSCTDHIPTVQGALTACVRRSLCYPLYRNWELCQAVLRDVKEYIRLDRKAILKALLAIRKLLNQSQENRYILNDLYLTDYCVWIQSISEDDKNFADFRTVVLNTVVEKRDVGFDLELTEQAALLAMEEQSGNADVESSLVRLDEMMASLAVDSDDE